MVIKYYIVLNSIKNLIIRKGNENEQIITPYVSTSKRESNRVSRNPNSNLFSNTSEIFINFTLFSKQIYSNPLSAYSITSSMSFL